MLDILLIRCRARPSEVNNKSLVQPAHFVAISLGQNNGFTYYIYCFKFTSVNIYTYLHTYMLTT